jgi:hypothetical protein
MSKSLKNRARSSITGRVALLLATASLAGCAVGPDFMPPAHPT